jgi:hypothetical protein
MTGIAEWPRRNSLRCVTLCMGMGMASSVLFLAGVSNPLAQIMFAVHSSPALATVPVLLLPADAPRVARAAASSTGWTEVVDNMKGAHPCNANHADAPAPGGGGSEICATGAPLVNASADCIGVLSVPTPGRLGNHMFQFGAGILHARSNQMQLDSSQVASKLPEFPCLQRAFNTSPCIGEGAELYGDGGPYFQSPEWVKQFERHRAEICYYFRQPTHLPRDALPGPDDAVM